jgi:hypothetical protein
VGKCLNLYRNLDKLGIVEKEHLTDEEYDSYRNTAVQDLPEGIYCEISDEGIPAYYRYPVFSDQEISNSVAAYNAVNVRTIKKCMIFFTSIVILLLLIYLIILLVGLTS